MVNLKRPFRAVVVGPVGVAMLFHWRVVNDLGHEFSHGSSTSAAEANEKAAASLRHVKALAVFGDVMR